MKSKGGAVACKEKYHENELVEYHCQDCSVCICLKCGQTRHNHHNKIDMRQAAEERKTQMTKLLDRVKRKAVDVVTKMKEETELKEKIENEICSAEKKMTEIVEERIRILNEHKTAMKKTLVEIREAEQSQLANRMESLTSLAAELRESVECGEDFVKEGTSLEILQEKGTTILNRCEEIVNVEEMEIYIPRCVTYHVHKEISTFIPGKVVAFPIDHPSKSVAEGEGLKESECTECKFTVAKGDSEGNQCHVKKDKAVVKICSPAAGDVQMENRDDGNYTKSKNVDLHDVVVVGIKRPVAAIGLRRPIPLRGPLTLHTYKVTGSLAVYHAQGRGLELKMPWRIAVSRSNGNIAVADRQNRLVQLRDSQRKYLTTIKEIGRPYSVAFTASGDVIVIHGEARRGSKMSVFTESGHFITHIAEHLVNLWAVSVEANGNLIVCDHRDNALKVLSPDDGALIQSVRDPHSDEAPEFAINHQDMFFVSYKTESCVKVFSKDGEMLFKIGCKGTGDGQLNIPIGLTIDMFENLVVCDNNNKRIQVFSLDGRFLNSVNEGMASPTSVIATENGDLLVCDPVKYCIHVLH